MATHSHTLTLTLSRRTYRKRKSFVRQISHLLLGIHSLAHSRPKIHYAGLDPIAGTICANTPVTAVTSCPGASIFYTIQTPPDFEGQLMLNERYLFFTATGLNNAASRNPTWCIVRVCLGRPVVRSFVRSFVRSILIYLFFICLARVVLLRHPIWRLRPICTNASGWQRANSHGTVVDL